MLFNFLIIRRLKNDRFQTSEAKPTEGVRGSSSGRPWGQPRSGGGKRMRRPKVENPLETDPGIPLVIDPPILFFSSDTQMQAVGIKNRSSLHSA